MNNSFRKSLPKLSFVLGGAASGKSRFAENLVLATGLDRIYLATSQIYDTEMQEKVARHLAQRGTGWTTIEEPLDLLPILSTRTKDQVVLLDCATLWLTNIMLAERDISSETAALCTALGDCACPVVIVSNEVGSGIVPDNALAREFRNHQGALNQALAAQADLAVQVIAGLPLVLKGVLLQ